MESEDFLTKANKILDEVHCWNGLEDEVLKLYCLFTRCVTQKIQGQEVLNVNYVREKIFNLMIKHPIILDDDTARLYATMKIERDCARINLGEPGQVLASKRDGEYGFVYKTEYGTTQPVRFLDESMASMHDSSGNEILCKCGKPAGSVLIGKDTHEAYCSKCFSDLLMEP